MTRSQAKQVDLSQQRERSPVTQQPWLRSSYGLGWNHLSLLHKRSLPLQTPELQPIQHIIEINLSPNSQVECRADGHLHAESISYGTMMLAPANGYYQLANLQPMESIAIGSSP
jgi:hypothetical protein